MRGLTPNRFLTALADPKATVDQKSTKSLLTSDAGQELRPP